MNRMSKVPVFAVSRYICRRCASDLAAAQISQVTNEPVPIPIVHKSLKSAKPFFAAQKTSQSRPASKWDQESTESLDALKINALVSAKRKKANDAKLAEPIRVEPPEHIPVPQLSHGLDRVLFNPGVYYLQDPRSLVYNFDPYLQEITPVKDFNFDALTQYITSSRDETLDELARQHNLRIVGSTSSMTGVLSQFHFFISNWRQVDVRRLSTAFAKKVKTFTPAQKAPSSIYLRHNNGIYAIDADKSFDSGETILSFLGRSMEKMLTLPPEQFSRLRKENKADAPTEKTKEAYYYSKLGSMLMRSQLDCHDPRLPGTGTFDLKTRAVLPVRLDVKNAAQGAGYQIYQSVGLLESFEREYYDMIRAAFLKYSLQVRIGNMDGIFVAFHNTERIFGFQYISLNEMDEAIHGPSSDNVAQKEFQMSLTYLDEVLQRAIELYPGRSMSLSFATREDKKPCMDIIIEPLTEEQIKRRQQGEMLETLKAAQSGPRPGRSLESLSTKLENSSPLITDSEITMFRLTGTNLIDSIDTPGPPNPTSKQDWRFTYSLEHITNTQEIKSTLTSIRDRQASAYTDLFDEVSESSPFIASLRRMSLRGRQRLAAQPDSTPVIYSLPSHSPP